MPHVTFLQDGTTNDASIDENLSTVADRAGATLPFSCRNGTCSTCLVSVKKGAEHLSPVTNVEHSTLAIYGGDESKHRLACQCRVRGDVEIDLP